MTEPAELQGPSEFLTALDSDVVIDDVAEPGPLSVTAVMTTAEWWKRERRDDA